jgi:hypothetical protein
MSRRDEDGVREDAPHSEPTEWTGPRPRVTGMPVVLGAIVIGLVLVAMVASLTRRPGLASRLSQDYSAMMAGSLAAEIQTSQPDALAASLVEQGLPFVPRIVSLEPDFALLGGRRHQLEARRGAAWFYKAPSSELAIAEAFEGDVEALGPPDDTRADGPRPFRVFRKTTQTIVAWQDGGQLYVFTSTLPSEVVIGLARRLAGEVPRAPAR